jgi:hypothetical protein
VIVSPSFKAAARIVLAAALVLQGCVSSRAFVPTEHVTALSPRGEELAAEYPIVESGQSLGEVKVWSSGAVRNGSADDNRTRVRVGFELTNHGGAPLRLDRDRLFLEEMSDDGRARGRVAPEDVAGDLLVPSGESRQVEVAFVLPSSVWPSDVPGYRVAWVVVGTSTHARKTPFLRAAEASRAGDGYPYYGSYYGYPFYPGYYGPRYYRYYPGWPPPWRVRRFPY